jgi:hypothetical protein
MEKGIGGQITALLKLEYPSMIEESSGEKYYAKKWAHYDVMEDEEGMTAADRFREEFWVSIVVIIGGLCICTICHTTHTW